jgi:hypothetical protein
MDADVSSLMEAVEESFGVKFNRDEVTDETRIGDLCRMMSGRLTPISPGICFSSIVFWRLRKAFMNVFGVERSSIIPSASTELLLPSAKRRRAWRVLSETSGLRLPRLEYPDHLNAPILILSLLLSILIAIIGGRGWWLAAAAVAMPLAASLLFSLARPFADILPAQCHTLGDIAKVAVGLNYSKLAQEYGPSNDQQTAEALRRLIADLVDIDPNALIEQDPRLIDIVLVNDGFRIGA